MTVPQKEEDIDAPIELNDAVCSSSLAYSLTSVVDRS